MGGNKANKQRKIIFRIILAPIKILSKVRDFYMKSMQDCAGIGYSTATFGSPAVMSQSVLVPKSFNVNFSQLSSNHDEEFKQLLRRKSVIESLGMHFTPIEMRLSTMGSNGMGRNYSVGLGKIGRIDEERACSFREDDEIDEDLYRRIRSHALKRNVVRQM